MNNKASTPAILAHPGEVLSDLIESNELTITQVAADIKVARATVSRLVNGRRPVSTDMAIRLGIYFGNGPKFWSNLQIQYEVCAFKKDDPNHYDFIEPFSAPRHSDSGVVTEA